MQHFSFVANTSQASRPTNKAVTSMSTGNLDMFNRQQVLDLNGTEMVSNKTFPNKSYL